MKKLWDLKKVLSYLELEGQGCVIIMEVTRPLVKWPITPNKSAGSVRLFLYYTIMNLIHKKLIVRSSSFWYKIRKSLPTRFFKFKIPSSLRNNDFSTQIFGFVMHHNIFSKNPTLFNKTFSHSNSSKTTGQKNPLQVTSDPQRVFPPGHSCFDLTSFSIL